MRHPMRPATVPKVLPVAEPASQDRPGSLKAVRALIWVYLALLLVEGALRKWALPSLSDPLLIIRDPVVLGIYFFAIRAHVFPRNAYVVLVAVVGALSMLVSIVLLSAYVPMKAVLLVTLYGFRCDFLHLPLMFVMAAALDLEDVRKVGYWTLLLMIPMAVLMILQFRASPDSFINRAVGLGEGQQLATAGGKIRPPGPFSFISGPIFYLSVATAFVIYGALSVGAYRGWLLLASSAAILIGVIVSGSRACVLAVALVAMAVLIILLVRPSAVNKLVGTVLALAIIGFFFLFIGSRFAVFKEGFDVLSERFTTSAEIAETSVVGGLIERVVQEFTEPFEYIAKIPVTGYGLGLGTAGGARFFGQAGLLLSENEWLRIIAESGPLLGLGFIILRIALTGKLLMVSLRALKAGQVLSILLFSTVFLGMLNGQLGQPTTLGFTVVLAGLCLAAANTGETTNNPETEEEMQPKRLPRRSVFADRIHGTANSTDHANGSVDR